MRVVKKLISYSSALILSFFSLLLPPLLLYHHGGTNQVQVLITDENDCVPEFLQSIYSVDGVPETVTTATSLLQGETLLTPYFTSICLFLKSRKKTQTHFFQQKQQTYSVRKLALHFRRCHYWSLLTHNASIFPSWRKVIDLQICADIGSVILSYTSSYKDGKHLFLLMIYCVSDGTSIYLLLHEVAL